MLSFLRNGFCVFIVLGIFFSQAYALGLSVPAYDSLAYPQNYDAYMNHGIRSLQGGNAGEAVMLFSSANLIAEKNLDPQKTGRIAYFYLWANRPDKALNAYARGKQLALHWAQTHREYAMQSQQFLINLYNQYITPTFPNRVSQELANTARNIAVDLENLRRSEQSIPKVVKVTGRWVAECLQRRRTEYGTFDLTIQDAINVYGTIDSQVTQYRLDVSGNLNAGDIWAFGRSSRVQQFYLLGRVAYTEGRIKQVGGSSISFLVQDDGGQWSDCRGDWEVN